MAFKVQKATREKIYTKVALMSPSGGGKTYSALNFVFYKLILSQTIHKFCIYFERKI